MAPLVGNTLAPVGTELIWKPLRVSERLMKKWRGWDLPSLWAPSHHYRDEMILVTCSRQMRSRGRAIPCGEMRPIVFCTFADLEVSITEATLPEMRGDREGFVCIFPSPDGHLCFLRQTCLRKQAPPTPAVLLAQLQAQTLQAAQPQNSLAPRLPSFPSRVP